MNKLRSHLFLVMGLTISLGYGAETPVLWQIGQFDHQNTELALAPKDYAKTAMNGSWVLYDGVSLETPPGTELAPATQGTRITEVRVPPVWLKQGDVAVQPISVRLRHVGAETAATLKLGGGPGMEIQLRSGAQSVEMRTTPTEKEARQTLVLTVAGTVVATAEVTVKPPPVREVWLLPHSHVDIGYTHRQDEVVKIQIANLEKAMELARASAMNPPGMRFKWNPEAVWSLDHFLSQATPEKRQAFIRSVRQGDVGVDGLYGNMLTGLCRPEELAQCLSFGARLSSVTGVPVESAAICDVPGYTWGLVTMMAQAGVRYFAIGPNFTDRVGTIHRWDNQPFYWKSPSGQERLLCWVVDNYHFLGNLEEQVLRHTEKLERIGFPYDTTFLFWVGTWPGGGVDNAPPDEQTVEKVMAWNAKYAAPQVVIGLARDFFREFEYRHGAKLQEYSGDLTPYWEDGAGSTSRETALNRSSADRLAQAEMLFALLDPAHRPAARFAEAWKNVLLYSEHTWGAWCSISKPDDPFTLDQWRVKQAFALEADRQSHELLREALAKHSVTNVEISAVDVFNTTQWPRADVVELPETMRPQGVLDEQGQAVPTQKLASGKVVFWAKNVPAFGARRYQFTAQAQATTGHAKAAGATLATDALRVVLDPVSGAIKSLRLTGLDQEFVDPKAPVGLNEYRYVLGADAKGAKTNGAVTISVLDAGPLVASLRVVSEAPGCEKLVREVRVVDGLDRVELIDDVDRQSVRQKDAVHFGFGFNVPGGQLRMETPWAVVRPNIDQLPGSCRNWFTVQRWVDVSNRDYGIAWAPLDAPLMEIGGMTANLLGSVALPEWMTNAMESSTIYSWAQNNHWHTNYKIDQPGVTRFRFLLRPHRGTYSASAASRFGMETTRPLVATPVRPDATLPKSLIEISSSSVLVETVKLSEDGAALIVRLFGVSGKNESVKLTWNAVKPTSLWLTDLSERRLKKATDKIAVAGYGVAQVRAELR